MELRVGIIALVAVAYALCYLHVVAPPFGKYSCGALILLNYLIFLSRHFHYQFIELFTSYML